MENLKFTFNCPHCGQPLEAETDWVGLECDCPSCGRVIQIPTTNKIADNGKSAKCDESPQKEQENSNEGIGLGPKGAVFILLGVVAIGLLARLIHTPTNLQDGRNSSSSYMRKVAEPTESEKMAMGRVFYVYAKKELQASSVASYLASQGQGCGGNAFTQLLAASMDGGGILFTKVDTEGCPQDFADAWKGFVDGATRLKQAKNGYNFIAALVQAAQQNGQYVDWDTRNKLAKMEQKLPRLQKECTEKTESFVAVCRKYGLENLKQWSLEAYRRYEGNQ